MELGLRTVTKKDKTVVGNTVVSFLVGESFEVLNVQKGLKLALIRHNGFEGKVKFSRIEEFSQQA